LVLGTSSIEGCGSSNSIATWGCPCHRSRRWFTVTGHRNHYAVLGISPNASSSNVRRAYRLLALNLFDDKEVGATVAFKSIHLAYDRVLEGLWEMNGPFIQKYWDQYNTREEQFPFYDDANKEVSEEENTDEERGSFIEVLRSAFLSLSLSLLQTVGIQLSLTYSIFMVLIDQKLDAGYKFGYLFAWVLGGRGGILLTMFLSFASWVCDKTSSSVVALVVVAMWFDSNLARYAPLPQGALLTLLYMPIRLQVDLN
ncbi:hypothetical protein Pfo_029588, partial [Paulownia fortunei]